MEAKLSVENVVELNKFIPRDYQFPIVKAFESGKYRKFLIVMGRRAGKDIVCFNLMIRAALKRMGIYYYLLPNAVQARRVMFDGITSEGMRILDYVPQSLVKAVNIQQLKITLINNSIIQFVGSENYDSLRGTNPVGVVFSEYAYSHPQSYPTIRPVLLANDGWVIFISTPFGENHFYTLYEIAKHNEDWFSYYMPASESGHISRDQIQKEIESGEISPDMAEQEYECSFSVGAIGAYYSQYLNRMELNNQIIPVDWESNFPVHTAWDLGMKDSCVILMFQVIGRQVHIIDMYDNSGVGLEHYINVLQSKQYTWGKHFAPHDVAVRDFTAGGLTRMEKASQLGFKFVMAQQMSVMDGIESVRTALPRIYIDNGKCKKLIAALRNYRKEWDSAKRIYKNTPLHDNNSDFCDALRYLCVSLPKAKDTHSNAQDLERRYREAVYGEDNTHMPSVFRNDLPPY